jgi:hypothetical protein
MAGLSVYHTQDQSNLPIPRGQISQQIEQAGIPTWSKAQTTQSVLITAAGPLGHLTRFSI